MPLILLGGIDRLATVERALDEGFAFVQMARALCASPISCTDAARRRRTESLCVHCNKCMPTIYRARDCVLVPARSAARPTGHMSAHAVSGGWAARRHDRGEALGSHDVEVVVVDLGQPRQQGVEVVVHRQMPAREAVSVPGGQPQDQLGWPRRARRHGHVSSSFTVHRWISAS